MHEFRVPSTRRSRSWSQDDPRAGVKKMTRQIVRFLPLCLCLLGATNPAPAQTKANQLIDQMIDALGGQTFLDVDDIHTTGRFFAFTRGQLSGSDIFADYIKFPDMERVE